MTSGNRKELRDSLNSLKTGRAIDPVKTWMGWWLAPNFD